MSSEPTEYTYMIGYACPKGTFGREYVSGPHRIETEADIEGVQTAVRRLAGEPTAFVLSVSLLSGPDASPR